MSIGRRLRAVALLLAMVVAGVSGAGATASAASASRAGPAVTASDACAGRAARTSASGACTSSVVAPVDVARSTTPFRRLSAGAWTAVPRPVTQALASTVETGGVTSCPRPPPADNHSRAPPSP